VDLPPFDLYRSFRICSGQRVCRGEVVNGSNLSYCWNTPEDERNVVTERRLLTGRSEPGKNSKRT